MRDRLIWQALPLLVLQLVFEPGFSESSYGFRLGRSALQEVQQAWSYVAKGRCWVLDLDLEKFIDRVNHDMLMARERIHTAAEQLVTLRTLEEGGDEVYDFRTIPRSRAARTHTRTMSRRGGRRDTSLAAWVME